MAFIDSPLSAEAIELAESSRGFLDAASGLLASAAQPAPELTRSLQDLPWASLTPVIVVAVIGIVIWLAGGKILRAAFVLLGLVVGAVIGLLVGVMLGLGVPGWIFAIAGALLLGGLGMLTYRIAVALGLAVLLGVAAPAVVWSLDGWQGPEATENERVTGDDSGADDAEGDVLDDWLREANERYGTGAPLTDESNESMQPNALSREDLADAAERIGLTPDTARSGLERIRQFLRDVQATAEEQWQRTPERLRSTMMVAALLGGLLGLLLGLLAPKRTAAAVTACGGAALALGAGAVLLTRTGTDAWLPTHPLVWAGIWAGASFIGLAFQWAQLKRKHDKQA